MLTYLLNILSSNIIVDVSPDRFIFKRNDTIETIKTIIYLSDNSAKRRVLGIGDKFFPNEPNKRIELFKENRKGLLPPLGKAECLDEFFRFAFRLVTRRTAMVRPKVVFQNSDSLDKLLCGYQDKLLQSAAVNAGARECVFES